MRARAALQRFPIAQWKENLSVMQDTAIRLSQKQAFKERSKLSVFSNQGSGISTPRRFWSGQSSMPNTVPPSALPSAAPSGQSTRASSPTGEGNGRRGPLSLGLRVGPGHAPKREGRRRKRLTKSNPASRASSIGPSSAPNSRNASPARRFKRKSKSQVRDSALDTTSEDVPAIPPLPERLNGRLPAVPPLPEELRSRIVSRFTEGTEQDGNDSGNESQGDVRRLRFTSMIGEDTQGGSISGDERTDIEDDPIEAVVDEYILSPEEQAASKKQRRAAALRNSDTSSESDYSGGASRSATTRGNVAEDEILPIGSPTANDTLLSPHLGNTPAQEQSTTAPAAAYLSLGTVLQGKKDYKLQNVEPFFTDSTGLYYNAFEKKLKKLNGKSSESTLCVEEYLTMSEKDWFNRFRDVKMGKSAASTPASSVFRLPLGRHDSNGSANSDVLDANGDAEYNRAEQYLLNEDYKPPTGIKKILLTRIGQWPLYSFLLAFVSIPLTILISRTKSVSRAKSSLRTHIKLHFLQVPSAKRQRNYTSSHPSTSSLQSSGGPFSAPGNQSMFSPLHLPRTDSHSFS